MLKCLPAFSGNYEIKLKVKIDIPNDKLATTKKKKYQTTKLESTEKANLSNQRDEDTRKNNERNEKGILCDSRKNNFVLAGLIHFLLLFILLNMNFSFK